MCALDLARSSSLPPQKNRSAVGARGSCEKHAPVARMLQLGVTLDKKFTAMTKVGFVSLGCPKNLVDSEVMMGILAREGYELTPRADEAEILVVNTCSFIEP